MGPTEPQAPATAGVVLLNPVSGASRGYRDPKILEDFAAAHGCRLEASKYAGQLVDMAKKEALSGCKLMIAAGGDDTVREVLLGMDQAGVFRRPLEDRPFFGIIPLGTFNNFARFLGVPADAGQALDAAVNGEVCYADLGRAGGRLFTESVGVGIDVAAWKEFPPEHPSVFRRLWDGARAVIKAITLFRPRRYFLEVDGQLYSVRAYSITVANCSYFSASIAIAPHAVLDDGQLDLCIIPSLSKLRFLGALPLIFLGKHTAYLRGVRYQQVKKVSISSERRGNMRIDGSLGPPLPVTIEVLPHALPMRLPAKTPTGG